MSASTGTVTRRFTDPYGNTRGTAATWSSGHGVSKDTVVGHTTCEGGNNVPAAAGTSDAHSVTGKSTKGAIQHGTARIDSSPCAVYASSSTRSGNCPDPSLAAGSEPTASAWTPSPVRGPMHAIAAAAESARLRRPIPRHWIALPRSRSPEPVILPWSRGVIPLRHMHDWVAAWK